MREHVSQEVRDAASPRWGVDVPLNVEIEGNSSGKCHNVISSVALHAFCVPRGHAGCVAHYV